MPATKVICPFSVVVDVMEKNPFSFAGMRADADQRGQEIEVTTVFRSLGVARGDYSIAGLESEVGIERKSMEDAHGTILGWGERRERFARELETLASLPCSAVVVECNRDVLIASAPQWGVKTSAENAKTIHRSILSWVIEYRVPWLFARDRRMAEIDTFRVLAAYWKKKERERRASRKVEKQLELL